MMSKVYSRTVPVYDDDDNDCDDGGDIDEMGNIWWSWELWFSREDRIPVKQQNTETSIFKTPFTPIKSDDDDADEKQKSTPEDFCNLQTAQWRSSQRKGLSE